MHYLDFWIFVAVIFVLIVVGIYQAKNIQSESAYLFAGRKIGWSALTATLVMTEFNSATLISFSSLGYAAGFWALTLPCIFLFGLLFYALIVAEKWKDFDGISVAGFFREKYGSTIGKLASLLLLIAMLIFSGAYIKSLTILLHPLFPFLNLWAISGILLAAILAMSLRGGLTAIIRTDILGFILMPFFFALLIFFVWKLPAIEVIFNTRGPDILPLRVLFSLTILTMFTYILAPWYGQKIFAAKSKRTAYWSVIAASILIFLFYGTAIFATALLRKKGIECPSGEEVLPHLISRFLPIGFKGFAYALLFITSSTTLTGVWSAMSAMVVGDFLKQDVASCSRSILVTVVFAGVSYVFANTMIDRIFDKLILANIPIAALSFGLLAGFYWKKASSVGVYASIIIGCLSGGGAYAFFGEAGGYTWYWAVYGIPLSFIAGIIGSYSGTKYTARYNVNS